MTYNSKTVLRNNLLQRMAADPSINSPTKLAKKCVWPRGKKKGATIAARTIGYIFESEDESPSPSLDVVEALAKALKVELWELLVDTEKTRRNLIERILGASAIPDHKLGHEWDASKQLHEPKAPYQPAPSHKKHGS